MKQRIPVEIDSLMWTLAETKNQAAIDEFISRNPLYRAQLLKRIETVGGLKAAKVPATTRVQAPRFEPLKTVPSDPSRMLVGIGIGVGLMILAIAAFVLTYNFAPSAELAPSKKPPNVHATRKGQTPEQPKPDLTPDKSSGTVENSLPVENESASTVILSIRSNGQPLASIFRTLESLAKVEIISSRDLDSKIVSAKFSDVTAMQALETMGLMYGFTAIDQHNGQIIVLPGTTQKGSSGTASKNLDQRRIGG